MTNLTPTVATVADAIVDEWRKRLPSLEEIEASGETEVRDDFVVPAIHLHIVISEFQTRSLRAERASTMFGSTLEKAPSQPEISRARAIRSFATNVVDSILCASGTVTRDQLIMSVIARVGLLPLAPVEKEAS